MQTALSSASFSGKFNLRCVACLLLWLSSACAFADDHDDLFFAVRFDDVNKVSELVKRGLSVNATESIRGETLLMIALRENSKKVFQVLLDHKDIKLEARASNGDTILMLASYLGDFPVVKKLVERGAEINQVGWTALHYAAVSGDKNIVALLLESSAYIDAESPNKTTPLMMAARSGKHIIVGLLLEEGADPYLKNDLGLNALDFAIDVEQREIAAILKARMQANKK
ncbi:ankyrin repeat domain-containing protein [Undibacterium umbellatum]|uniref:Ankyrin repeat domain-containing protein n=1 Tax=Undibacterium umbellatum TaxID=2762300 RepID=A0ABR6Z492_9BURK|nr:ankyrin repeat domain-containing protein [Undibacterium umbellatum]MBC3906160.1 ankyrin repeat domain-containing protein [Undibacterium umbellatum]